MSITKAMALWDAERAARAAGASRGALSLDDDEEREKLLRYVLKPKRPGVKLFLGAEDDPELAQLAHMLRVQKERV